MDWSWAELGTPPVFDLLFTSQLGKEGVVLGRGGINLVTFLAAPEEPDGVEDLLGAILEEGLFPPPVLESMRDNEKERPSKEMVSSSLSGSNC